jgi:hypothetical protein
MESESDNVRKVEHAQYMQNYMQKHRKQETIEDINARRAKDAASTQQQRDQESIEERNIRHAKVAESAQPLQ